MKQLVNGKDYNISEDGTLEIFEGVKHIPDGAFALYSELNNLILPSTLISIGNLAFNGCYGLRGTFTISDSVKYIMGKAFGCCDFSTIVLGKNLEFVGEKAFYWNSINKIINNSNKLKIIDKLAFIKNDGINEFTINNEYAYVFNAREISPLDSNDFIIEGNKNSRALDMYFYNIDENNNPEADFICNYKTRDKYTFEDGTLTIKDGVEVIGDFSKLEGCTNVIMPDSVIIILPGAFYNLEKLKYVRFSNNLLAVMDDAFYGCSLRKNIVKMPSSLCMFSLGAFKRNNGNNKIIVPSNAYTFDVYDELDSPYKMVEYDDLDDKKKYILNINDLLEKEKMKLESLGLLPETITKNKEVNHSVTKFQLTSMKKAFTDILMNKDYNEEINIEIITKILEAKTFSLNDIDYIVDHLFIKGQIKTIYLLISYGYNYLDNCMISKSIIYDMYEMIDILLLLGADINEIGCIELTPLSLACQKGDITLVNHLIEKGVAINMVDMNNKKAIDYALENNHQEIVALINELNSEEMSDTETDLEIINKKLRIGE